MPIRDVAEFLGDTIAVVVKHYAKFTTEQQALAVEKWKKAMHAETSSNKTLTVIEGGRKIKQRR